MGILREFRDFILRGNVVDLAVGIVIGGAFTKLVEGIVGGVIMPVVLIVTGRGEGKALLEGVVSLGDAIFNFLLLAAVVFFVFVKPMNSLKKKEQKVGGVVMPPKTEVLLEEIRDILRERAPKA